MRYAKKAAILILPFLILGAAWEIIFRMAIFPSYWFPAPMHVIKLFISMTLDGSLLMYSGISLLNTALGFLSGGILGLILGVFAGINMTFRQMVSPLISLVYPIPGIAWLPLVLLWFGFGYKAIIFTVGLGGFFSVFYNTLMGVQQIDSKYIQAGKAMGLSNIRMIREVYFWGAFPFIWSGLKLGYGRAWRTVIAGEMLSFNIQGLGWFIWKANEFFNFDQLLVGVLAIGIIGVIVEKNLFERVEEKILIRWKDG